MFFFLLTAFFSYDFYHDSHSEAWEVAYEADEGGWF